MRTRIMGIVAVAAIGLVAGCGGGGSSSTSTTSAANFKTGFASATAQLKQTAIAVGSAIKGAGGQSNSQVQSTFSSLADQWQSAVTKLDGLTPPSAASSDFSSLKTSAANVESDLKQISSAAGSNDVTAAKAAAVKVVTDILAAKSAAQKVQGET